MSVTNEMIKQLREATQAGILDCKKALDACGGDMERATEKLREKGLISAAKKADRVAANGLIEAYVHMGKAAALVELNCETDFVARLPEFKELAHDLAMQVVAAKPEYVGPEDIPAEVLESKRRIYRAEALEQKKPEAMLERIIEGKLNKFYADVCILHQPFIKDQEKIVQDVIKERIAKTGENMVLRRFVRFELSEQKSCS
jgi:elongation factor Ts